MELGVEVGDLLKSLIVYGIISTFVFVQPAEFRSAGFTLDNIFHQFLGNRQADYLGFQLRRITLTQISHILFIPGFFLIVTSFSEEPVFAVWPENWIQVLCSLSVLFASVAIGFVTFLSQQHFRNHYVVRKLRKQYDTEWDILATEVTRELNDPFAVRAVDSSESGIYVLDNWLLRVTLYNIELVKLEDAKFTVVKSMVHPLSSQNEDHQIILIQVDSFSSAFKSFPLNLQSRNIMQLIRNKVGTRFHVAGDVSLTVSTVDRFVETFRTIIAENETCTYQSTEELENCFGCMAVLPNVKLQQVCDNPECTQCTCRRPMWCHSCLARVFASEQEQEAHHVWLRRSARCPNCRNRFCVLDVLPMQIERQN